MRPSYRLRTSTLRASIAKAAQALAARRLSAAQPHDPLPEAAQTREQEVRHAGM